MVSRRITLALLVSALVLMGTGGIVLVSADGVGFNPGWPTDPDFYSPGWVPATGYISYSDDFSNYNWSPTRYTSPFTSPGFTNANWNVISYRSNADSDFLYSNWSVKDPVVFRYSTIPAAHLLNYDFAQDPFATDQQLRDAGWTIEGDFWGPNSAWM